jgi:hypothetical protein
MTDRVYLARLEGPNNHEHILTVSIAANLPRLEAWGVANRGAAMLNERNGSELWVHSIVREGASLPLNCYQARYFRKDA